MRLAKPCPETGRAVRGLVAMLQENSGKRAQEEFRFLDHSQCPGSSGSNGTCVCLTHTTHRWHLLCRLSSRSVFRLAGHTLLVSNRVGSQSGLTGARLISLYYYLNTSRAGQLVKKRVVEYIVTRDVVSTLSHYYYKHENAPT
jgi:hypothetical protein